MEQELRYKIMTDIVFKFFKIKVVMFEQYDCYRTWIFYKEFQYLDFTICCKFGFDDLKTFSKQYWI